MARRWGLIVLSVISLVALAYAGVITAFSVPVTSAMEAQARLPGADEPHVGERALTLPFADPTQVPTVLSPGSDPSAKNGTLLLVADPGSSFPAGAQNASLVRALAFVAPTANNSYVPPTLTLPNVTFVDAGGNVTTENVTVDVGALAGGKAGFLVKGDAERNVTFAPTDHVLGTVARYDAAGLLYTLFALGAGGFVLPIVVIIVTHKGAARAGVPGGLAAPSGACRECRAPMQPGATFCTKCGAWADPKQGSG